MPKPDPHPRFKDPDPDLQHCIQDLDPVPEKEVLPGSVLARGVDEEMKICHSGAVHSCLQVYELKLKSIG